MLFFTLESFLPNYLIVQVLWTGATDSRKIWHCYFSYELESRAKAKFQLHFGWFVTQ